ncbi:AP2-associated protein kinase 1-like [Halichondria panicea]|uniref:AP2-associated protein kinase 1-like n=1 Tax=Halichondria panicea TaxID=6063 RepID=UPI00312B4223
MDTPFGDNPLAIVSAQYSIPEDSPYTQDLHNFIGYLLTSDPELCPSIWQVCEVVSRITGTTNHVTNVFTGSSFPTDDFGSTSFDGRSSTPPTHNTADNAR